ncbi:alpha/beta fold hydrolase [Nonomuraea phyllanthi]|uniref:alpha/beta hydrolase n=1 Tax=Nonomuraea phyllanthi TaxID=2219224 RepID=UPI001292E42A|nr:alpha/beta hydrolase [Nonomuraea phyllanthi]QFY08144.1 alpha/beta fold hydrolase [Nonomuraea phyllanthi]
MWRLGRALATAFVVLCVAVPISGAARPEAVRAPVPPPLAPLRSATPSVLAQRYAAARDAILAAERGSEGDGDRWRATRLRDMADASRHFLAFDGRDGGRAVEVFGDLATAERVAVLVPGAGTDLDKYGLLRGGALRLRQALGDRAAVIAWLGYRTPSTLSLAALTEGRAEEAAPGLRAFVRELAVIKPAAAVSLLCHSYGSVICARAASGMDVAGIILYGSPGVAAPDVTALRTRAPVWAGRSGGDWIAHVPHERVHLPFVTLGFGTDPVSPRFGARVFAAGSGGHSDYLRPGPSLDAIVRIVSGPEIPAKASPTAFPATAELKEQGRKPASEAVRRGR